MNTQIETIDPSRAELRLSLDSNLYPRDVLYAAAYVFLDRAYVLLDCVESRYVVSVRCKEMVDEAKLRSFAGEFENELLAQALRLRVFNANRNIIEKLTNLAIFGAAGPGPSLEAEQSNGPDAADTFIEDPLGIAAPWEAKKG